MQKIVEPHAYYLQLNEKGISITQGALDLKQISVRCSDLSRYRKALRVKIRALLKVQAYGKLQVYINALYRLALFTRYVYGFHSCNSDVSLWQERLASLLQKEWCEADERMYDGSEWIGYDLSKIEAFIHNKAREYKQSMDENFVQDAKPFLNPKDQSHFDKVLSNLKEEDA